MEDINDLFEEGITRSRELTEAADEAMNAVDQMAREAESLALRVEDEGREACQHLRDLAARLEQAEGELEDSRVQAEGALQDAAGKAEELKAGVADLLARIEKSMDDLQSRKDVLDDSLDARTVSAQEDFEELARKTQGAEVEAERGLEEAAQSIADLRSAIDAARTEMAQKQQAWAAAMEALEAHARDQAGAWLGGFSELLSRQATALIQAGNVVVDQHNEAMEGLRRRFAEDAPLELGSALTPVVTALEELGHAALQQEPAVTSEAQRLKQAVSQLVPVASAIKTVLEDTARLHP